MSVGKPALLIPSRAQPGRQTYKEECTPTQTALVSVLAAKTWPGVPPLLGIIGAPVLRRDGTLLQTPGYDPATGLFLASRVDLPPVPEKPTAEQVAEARSFLLDRFLRDFPWASDADRANYVALLATPILRPFTRSLTPFAMIDATMAASGKTILTGGPGMLYGQKVLIWPDAEEELRKQITAVFTEQVGVVIWDNLHPSGPLGRAVHHRQERETAQPDVPRQATHRTNRPVAGRLRDPPQDDRPR